MMKMQRYPCQPQMPRLELNLSLFVRAAARNVDDSAQ